MAQRVIFTQPLQPGILLRRYKRFLADVQLDNGEQVTAHCPNTGAMTGCNEPGSRVWLSRSDNAKRKYPLTLEQVASTHGLVGVNTAMANRLVKEALGNDRITELVGYSRCRPEAVIPGGNGRFDFLLSESQTLPNCYVEVKSVTLGVGNGAGLFPDAVSARARKHVQALEDVLASGLRAVLLFCVQHSGIDRVAPAAEIDPGYATALQNAAAAGVEVIAYRATANAEGSTLDTRLPVFVGDAME